MASKIILKKSSVADKAPVAGDLDFGELAINYTDSKLYFKKADGSIDAFTSAVASAPVTSVGGNTGAITDAQLLNSIKNVDGAGSGLDADFLDGLNASSFYLASNPNGYTSNTGTVTSVGATTPLVSSGGNTPSISIPAANSSTNGYMSAAYASKLDGIAAGATNVTNNNQLANGAGYITSAALSNYLPLSGGTLSGDITVTRIRGVNNLVLDTYTTVNPSSNVFLYSQPNDRDSWLYLDSADTGSNWGIYHRQIDSAVSGLPGNSIGFVGGGSSTLQAWISLANGSANFAGALTQAGNQVLHAGNYSGYSTFSGGVTSSGNNGFYNNVYYSGVRNPIWSFGNASSYGISYFQGSSGVGGLDTFGVSVNGSTSATGVNFAVTSSASYVNNNVVLHAGNYTSYAHSISSNPSTSGPGLLAIGNQGSYSFVQSHNGQPLNLNPVGNSVQIAGNTVLHAGNYTGYSPSLSGSGASGTWGINISGNAATASNSTLLNGYGSSSSGGGDVILRTASNGYLYLNSWIHPSNGSGLFYDSGVHFYEVGNYMYSSTGFTAASDIRAPLFYDSNDTGYYIDPNSTANNALRMRGGAHFGPNTTWGASLYVGGDGRVGTSATVAVTNGNLHIDAQDGYSLYLNWYNTANIYTQSNLGVGSSSADYRLHVHGTGYATSDFRAPVFYDSNDTSYYVDANNTSVFYQINTWGRIAVDNPLDYSQTSVSSLTSAPLNAYAIYDPNVGSTSKFLPLTHQTSMYSGGYRTHLNTGLYKSVNGWGENDTGWYAALGGNDGNPTMHWKLTFGTELYNSNGFISQSGSFRAPVFYDSNDTNYYVDPNSTSRIRKTNLIASGSGWDDGLNLYSADQTNRWNFLTDLGASNSLRIAYNNSEALIINSSRNITAHVDIRTPIFYDSNDTSYYVDPNSTSSLYRVNINNNILFTNYGRGMIGSYSADRYQAVFAMGDSYKLPDDGTSTGSLYGIAWSHPNAGGVASNLNTHGALIMENGTFLAALSGSIRSRDDMRSPIFYDSNDTGYYVDAAAATRLNRLYINQRNDNYNIGSINGPNSVSDLQSLTNTDGQWTVTQFNGIDNYTNSPPNIYTYGSVMSWRTLNHSFQLYASHTGDLSFKTQWNNDNYSGWRRILHESNVGSFAMLTGSSATNSVDIRTPIFYDSNNTAYYIDPDTSTRLNGQLRIDGGHGDSTLRVALNASNNGAATGEASLQMWCSEPNVSWDWGGFGYNVQNDGDSAGGGFGRPNTGFGQAYMRMGTGGQWYFYTTNTSGTRYTNMYLAPNNGVETYGVFRNDTDVRAPLFYDSNDTTYYVDPNSTSNLVGLTVANTITGSVTGSASSATSLNSSNYINRTGSSGNLDTDFQNTPAGTMRYQGDDSNLTNSPGGTWWIYENKRHSNSSNYWGTQVAWGWEDNANKLATRNITGNSFGGWVYYLNSSNYSSYALPLSGGTLTGVLNINNTSDYQLLLQSTDSWTGIAFNDGAVSGNDYIWHNGNNNTFAIGGGGADVAGKKLHVHGGMTIGSGYSTVTNATNGLNVEGAIQQAGNQVLNASNYTSYSPSLTGTGASGSWGISVTGSSGSTTGNAATATTATNQSGGTINATSSILGTTATVGSTAISSDWLTANWSPVQMRSSAVAGGVTGLFRSVVLNVNAANSASNTPLSNRYIESSVRAATFVAVTASGTTNAAFYWRGAPAGTAGASITWATPMVLDANGYLLIGYGGSNGAYPLQVNGQIFATSSTIATSDARYKEDVHSLEGALDVIKALRPVQFKWKKHDIHNFNTDIPTVGFLAQEVQQVLADKPYLNSIVKLSNCILEEAEKDEDDNVIKEAVTEEFLGIAESNIIALLTRAVQEQQAIIEAQEERLARLESIVSSLTGE